MPRGETVVLIHGLWLTGREMVLLRRRLRHCGFAVVVFDYPSVRRGLMGNAAALQRLVAGLDAATVHFVAHSLGGLLLRQFFHDFPHQRRGRVVTLGTPHRGSTAARRLARWRLGRLLLGRSLQPGLLGGLAGWPAGREIGVIAGDRGLGLGRLLGGLPRPNDGVVAVAESHLPGETDYRLFHVGHTGLLFSAPVASAVCRFLRDGRF